MLEAQPIITYLIIGLTVLVSIQAFSRRDMYEKLLFHPQSIQSKGEFFRFWTHGFLHADYNHLLINMYVLYIFGGSVEMQMISWAGRLWGILAYLALYLISIAVATLPTFMKHRNDFSYRAVGASGATSAIVFAFIVFQPWATLLLFFIIPCPAIIAAVLFLMYESYMERRGVTNIAHNVHIWGAVFGVLFTLAFVAVLGYLPYVINNIMNVRFGN